MKNINDEKLIEELAKSLGQLNHFYRGEMIDESMPAIVEHIAFALRAAGIKFDEKDFNDQVADWTNFARDAAVEDDD